MNSKGPKLTYLFLIVAILFFSTSMILFAPLSCMFQHGSISPEIKSQFHIQQLMNDQDRAKSLIVSPDFLEPPLYFIPNNGQFDEEALFCAQTSRYTLWLTTEALVFDSVRREYTHDNNLNPSNRRVEKKPKNLNYKRDVSRLIFLNTHNNPVVYPLDCAHHKVNYFTRNDKSKWRTNIETSRAVLYKNLYDKIDMKISGVEEELEYDFIIRPGGNVSDIHLEYEAIRGTRIDESGHLVIDTRFGELMHKKPECYQIIEGERVKAEAAFREIGAHTYGFKVEEFNRDYELIIDPMVIVSSTYMGGSGDDEGFDVVVNEAGEVYVAGDTMSLDFPILNPMQETFAGNRDIFVTKISSDGSTVLYSTYLGGSDWDWSPSIAVDNEGAIYLTGSTESNDFPTMNPYQENNAGPGADVFITKIDAAGTELVYSTYLGGSLYSRYEDGPHDYGLGIDIDSVGAAYVTGETWTYDFPTKNAIEEYYGGLGDSFVTKINPQGTDLVYSTLLPVCTGGIGWDAGFGIAVDSEGAAYVTGVQTCDYPIGPPEVTFVMKIRPEGDDLEYRLAGKLVSINSEQARLRGSQGRDIAVDVKGAAYIVGDGGPRTKDRNAFISKYDPAGMREYSFSLWGSRDEYGYGITVDSEGAAYVTGSTNSIDFRTVNPLQENRAGGMDAFVAKVSPEGDELEYSTYLGGARADVGRGIAAGANGVAYVVGGTYSINFPTKNPVQENNAGGSDAFITKLSFSTYSLEVKAGTGGTTDPSPGNYDICVGSEIMVKAIPNEGFGFSHWSGDATSQDNPVTVLMDRDKSIQANFVRQYALNISAGLGGTTDPIPGKHVYNTGTKVTIMGIPENDYRFSHWSGDIGGRTNPKTISMNSDKSVTANFIRIIYPPSSFSGKKFLNRSLSQAEYINVLSWQVNTNNENIQNYKIYTVDGQSWSLLVELNANTFEYWHRRVVKDKPYTYAIVAVNDESREGDPAYVTVQ